MTYHVLYKTTNLINGKIYIGVHKTEDINDPYMGSGKRLLQAIEKYGAANFEKTILEYFDDAENMYAREKEIVNEEFLCREDVYNLKAGEGGFDWINDSGIGGFKGRIHSEETKKKISDALTGRVRPDLSKQRHDVAGWTKEACTRHSESMSQALKGKKKSESHKAKISAAVREKLKENPEIKQKQIDAIRLYHEKKREKENN